jgi:hypothetical protein
MGLAPAEPSFRAQMLEEGMEAAAPIMIALGGWKRAGNVQLPAFSVGETAVLADFAQRARRPSLIGYSGGSIRDCSSPRSILFERFA